MDLLAFLFHQENPYIASNVQERTERKRRAWSPRPTRQKTDKALILSDLAVIHYFEALRNKIKNTAKVNGQTVHKDSTHTIKTAVQAVRMFFEHLQVPYAENGLHTLIETCKHNPKRLEEINNALTEFSNLEPLPSHRAQATYIKGLFHKNGLVLTGVNIDNHFNGTPEEIDPLTLKDVYNALSHRQQTIINALAYTGLRPQQLAQTRPDQIKPFNEEYWIIDYSQNSDKFQVKTRLTHFAFIPTRIIQPAIQYANEHGLKTIFEDMDKINRDITDYAKAKFKVHITAKYWRQRFKTIAEARNVPANIFNWLEGSTPSMGANALNYAQSNKLRFLKLYDRLLAPYLSPDTQLDVTEALTGEQPSALKEQLDCIEAKLDELLEKSKANYFRS